MSSGGNFTFVGPATYGGGGGGGLTTALQMRGDGSGAGGGIAPGGTLATLAVNIVGTVWDLTPGNFANVVGRIQLRNAGVAGIFTFQYQLTRLVATVLASFDNILTLPAGEKINIPLYYNIGTLGNVTAPADRLGITFINGAGSAGNIEVDSIVYTTSEYIV